jgi:hypothetical protein
MSESISLTRAEMSCTQDEEEAAIRANIDLIERKVNYMVDISSSIQNECKLEVTQLIRLKKHDKSTQKQFHDMHSQTAALIKQRERRLDRARALSERIEHHDRKKEQLFLEKEKINYSFYSRQYYEERDLCERRSHLSVMREKHKLIDKSNKEQIFSLKKQLYLDCKRRQAEIMKESIEKHDIYGDEKRKRHLEVIYQEKITMLAKEIARKKKLEFLQDRIQREKDEKARATEETAKRLERLARYNQDQRTALMKQREQEQLVVTKYREAFLPKGMLTLTTKPTRKISHILDDLTVKGRKGSTNIEVDRAASLDTGSKHDISLFRSNIISKDSETDQLRVALHGLNPSKDLLMTSIDVPANKSSSWKLSRPTSDHDLSGLKSLEEHKPDLSTAKHTPTNTSQVSKILLHDGDNRDFVLPPLNPRDISLENSAGQSNVDINSLNRGDYQNYRLENQGLMRNPSNSDLANIQDTGPRHSEQAAINFSLGPQNRIDLPRSLVDPEPQAQRTSSSNRVVNLETRETAADLENTQQDRIRHLDTTQITYEDENTIPNGLTTRSIPQGEVRITSLPADLNLPPIRRQDSISYPKQADNLNLDLELRRREESLDSDLKGTPNLLQNSLDSADSVRGKNLNFVSFGGSKIQSSRGIPQKLDLETYQPKDPQTNLDEEF